MMLRKKKKLSKRQRQKLLNIVIPMLVVLASLLIGSAITLILKNTERPSNLVWAADNTVQLPGDLTRFLRQQKHCEQYRGTGSPTGVGLWGVYQVTHDKYAKIAYGCSWSLSTYIMAVKQGKTWRLIEPTEYFAPFKDGANAEEKGALPYCVQLEKYRIPKDTESFCISTDGSAKSNEL
jgi:hypothetical protein